MDARCILFDSVMVYLGLKKYFEKKKIEESTEITN